MMEYIYQIRNTFLDSQISDLFKKLEKAEKEGSSLESVFAEAKALSDEQLKDVQENCNTALCRYGVEKTNGMPIKNH